MKHYFLLHFRMINRHFADAGLAPLPGYSLALAGIAGLSIFLFSIPQLSVTYAVYVYVLSALLMLLRLGESSRNSFLRHCFAGSKYYHTRILENLVVVSPFVVFLLVKLFFLPAACLLVVAALMAFVVTGNNKGLVMPTPFYQRPFEFITGFRKTFLLFIAAYVLAGIAAWHQNFNLGIFSLCLVFFICMGYYTRPEPDFYVWVHKQSPAKFLLRKSTTALLFSTLLALPVLIVLGIFFPVDLYLILLFLLAGYLFLLAVVLAKYAAWPGPIDLPQGIVMALTLWFPPLLVAIVPVFYVQAVKKLKEIL